MTNSSASLAWQYWIYCLRMGSWNRFLPIEAAPGSGKSTLLRLFTPTVLTSIANSRTRPEYRDLVRKLTEIDAIDASGVKVLGVLVNCKEDYSRLADIPMELPKHEAVFRALLHSRLALLILRAALQLVGRDYPNDVDGRAVRAKKGCLSSEARPTKNRRPRVVSTRHAPLRR